MSDSTLEVQFRCGGGDDGAGFETAGPVKDEGSEKIRWKHSI